MHFLAVGKHGAVDAQAGRAVAPLSLEWIRARLQDGTITCAYSMEGGGRMLIVEAGSKEDALAMLSAAPDVERVWTITALVDAVESIERYLAAPE